jgi:hypothetical protein
MKHVRDEAVMIDRADRRCRSARLLVLRWLFSLLLVALPHTALASGLAGKFQSALDACRMQYGFPGATAAYVLPDGTVGVAATGAADLEAGIPMAKQSRMLAASIGKTFVGATACWISTCPSRDGWETGRGSAVCPITQRSPCDTC